MAPPLTVKYHTAPPGAMREVTRNESMGGWLLNPLHGCIGRWSLIDARLLGDVRFLNLRRKPDLV